MVGKNHKGSDGRFDDGALKGKLVNIKWYARREGVLDITPDSLPDYYLVMTGPKSFKISSRSLSRPWIVDNVYLFEARDLVAELNRNGVKIGVSSSVRQKLWEQAEIYPIHNNIALRLSEEQHTALELFSSSAVG